MRGTKRRGKYTWIDLAAWLLILTIYLAFQASNGGLAISVHFGMRTSNIQSRSEVCTRVEIIEGINSTHRYGISKPKSYNFYLSNGEVYRLCSFELESMGITDGQLRSLEGSVLTVEYVTTRFLHSAYPLLSIKTEERVIVPKQIAVEYWGNAWGGTLIALCSFGGLAIIIIIGSVIFAIVRTTRKKRGYAERKHEGKSSWRKKPTPKRNARNSNIQICGLQSG